MQGIYESMTKKVNITEEQHRIMLNARPHILSEGVRFDASSNSFVFDFEHDGETDVITLTNVGHSVDQFERCYFYGYEFSQDTDSKTRKEFIQRIKFPETFDGDRDLHTFISKAVGYLDSQISLPQYNVVVYPQSMSELNRKMLSYLSRITTTKYIEIELVKELPSNIEFDYERFNIEVLSSIINGRPRYTQAQKDEVLAHIEEMMDSIHKSDYFSIARDIKKTKFRNYITNFYKFKDEESKRLFQTLTNANIILIDDVVTSGTTIYHLLNTLRSLNDKNNIVIFSLIGKNIYENKNHT